MEPECCEAPSLYFVCARGFRSFPGRISPPLYPFRHIPLGVIIHTRPVRQPGAPSGECSLGSKCEFPRFGAVEEARFDQCLEQFEPC